MVAQQSEDNHMLILDKIVKTLQGGNGAVQILREVSLTVPNGQFVAVMGPSGSGKSTLLGLVAGLDAVTSGSIQIGGQEITRMNEDELARIRREKIGFVFQSFQLLPNLTALENIGLPLELAGESGADQRARELLAAVGLEGRARHYPVQLSGGEQQRIALARAFANRPTLLLADEPTGNLDTANGQVVLDLMLRLNREEGTTIVMVTHDRDVAHRADRVVRMKDGQVVADEVITA